MYSLPSAAVKTFGSIAQTPLAERSGNRWAPEPRQPVERAQQLLNAGAEWLWRGIEDHEPRVIIACGTDVRRKMREMDGAGSEIPEYQPGTPQSGWFRISTSRGQQRVRWFGVPHPTTRPILDPRGAAPCIHLNATSRLSPDPSGQRWKVTEGQLHRCLMS